MKKNKPSKADQARALLAEGMRPCEVAKRVGVTPGAVQSARRSSPTRGRPRVHLHPAEACARLIEDKWGMDGIAMQIRNGEWKKYLA